MEKKCAANTKYKKSEAETWNEILGGAGIENKTSIIIHVSPHC